MSTILKDQVSALLYKDFLLRIRHYNSTCAVLLCPALLILLSAVALFIIDDPRITKFETAGNQAGSGNLIGPPGSASMGLGLDPFPDQCGH